MLSFSFSFKVEVVLIFVVLGCLIWKSSAASATNTLNPGDELNSTASARLVSQNGNVTLRFVKQNYSQTWNNKDTGYYLAIYYTEDDRFNHPIWLANRDHPIDDDSGILTLDATGLKITRSSGTPIQLFSPTVTSSDTNIAMKLVLQDSGNLELQRGNNEEVLWQSFDHPTDTWLPGMKLGFGAGAGGVRTNWSVSSWLTDSIPAASGTFSLVWDPVGERLIVRLRNDRVLWTSGENYGNLPFSPDDPYNWNYNFTVVNSDDEKYVYYTLFINEFTIPERRKNGRLWLTSDGSLLQADSLYMFSSTQCAGDKTERGCEKWDGPTCRSNGVKFEKRSIRATSQIDYRLASNNNLSINDCKDICWNDCKCLGVSEASDLGCEFLAGSYVEGGLDTTPYQLIIGRHSRSRNYWIWILISIATVLTITTMLGILFYLRRRRRIKMEEKFLLELMTSDETSDVTELQTGNNGPNLHIYTSALIMSATNSFSPQNLLGKGGFGSVYKGILADGQEVAIKRLSKGSGQGLIEFKNELILIAKLQHTNLVRLLGFCIQDEEKMLVYEYMPNKSLDSFIFDESKRKFLDWNKRFSIIEGIAQGLLYLHKYSRLKIIHRDLKLSNILLDNNMDPKISDFGMARIWKANEADSNTNRIVGTYGYMPPEYAMDGIFSVKSDVYSFGVMVLEIVSGRKNNSRFDFDRPLNLVGYAWETWKLGAALELVDPTLSDSCSKHQILRCITLGLLCVEDNPLDRPTMSDVVSMLNGEMQLPLPKNPAFSTGKRVIMEEEENIEIHSLNGLTMSVMDAR